MNSPRWLGRLRRILTGFGPARGKPVSARSKTRADGRAKRHALPQQPIPAQQSASTAAPASDAAGRAAVTVVTMTVPVSVPTTATEPNAVAAPESAPRARTGKPQRTLEEVRSDLARLRESSRERQAERERTRDTNFAPTDFMDFSEHAMQPAPAEPAFAPTAYVDFGAARARQGR